MKKYLALLLALVMVLSLCACGNSAPAATEAPAAEPAAEPAADDLVSLAQAEGELVVYGSCEEEYLAAACENFEKLYGIKTTYQRLSTGEVQAKIEEENGNPSADVWFGGTTDPYNVVAGEGLLEAYEAENASHLLSDMYRDKDGYWYGIYTMIQKYGHDEGIQYLVDLDKNIQVYTKSGSGPSKNVGTGECVIGIGFLHDGITQIVDNGYDNVQLIIPSSGTSFEIGATAIFKGAKHPNAAKLWVEYALSPECVELAASHGSYQFLVIDNAKQPEQASEFGLDPENVMDYDFEDAKNNIKTYVEEVMTALGGGDDRFKTE